MKRFMGMMPSDEVKKEQRFKDPSNLTITVQAGPNGWTILWADASTSFQDVEGTTEANYQKALDHLAEHGFRDLRPFEPMGER